MVTVMLADDHTVVRNGLKMLLESEEDICVVGEASNGTEALEKVRELQPDIILLDIRMPGLDGIETTRQLGHYSDHTRALIISMYAHDEYVLRSALNGASGYVLKDATKDELIQAIRTVSQGNKYFSGSISHILVDSFLKQTPQSNPLANPYHLTKRERQILKLVAAGHSNEEIAQKLNNSIRTIETHRFRIMKKMGVNRKNDMVMIARQAGMV
uniref:Response regulator transcription factor n=1 Tax=Roseihalotalea indica TaxID=2867963 RepID=A0AA49JDB2_9BACT|nr:response regulator transcription factor [Tunicatimonas sp. TK19036]